MEKEPHHWSLGNDWHSVNKAPYVVNLKAGYRYAIMATASIAAISVGTAHISVRLLIGEATAPIASGVNHPGNILDKKVNFINGVRVITYNEAYEFAVPTVLLNGGTSTPAKVTAYYGVNLPHVVNGIHAAAEAGFNIVELGKP